MPGLRKQRGQYRHGRHVQRLEHQCQRLLQLALNMLNRQFRPERPDQAWVTDITDVSIQEGWLYLAAVMDLHSRMIVGWSMDRRMTRDRVIGALRMAWFRRRPKDGLIHHSDRASQYASHDYQVVLKAYGMAPSMSRKGNCWNNAAMESFFNSLKSERVHHQRYGNRE